MIYTITFNPSLDYVISVENFTENIINRTTNEFIFPGGKGINVSLMLNNLGLSSIALGFTSGFTGDEIKHLLIEKGIRTDFIEVESGISRINVKIKSETETEINGKGPNITATDINKLKDKLQSLSDDDILVLAGSIPSSLSDSLYKEIILCLPNKNTKVVVDATNDLLINTITLRPFLIKPNHYELGELFSTTITSLEDALYYGKKLQEKGALNILVSMAETGAVLISEDGNVFTAAAPKGKVINSVGAGDSMVAGFLAGYNLFNDYEKAFYLALYSGSASAFSNHMATKEDINNLLLLNNMGKILI